MLIAKKHLVLVAGALAFFLTGCGGGGGGGSATGTSSFSSLSGVAAVGSPIANADVRLVCASGSTPTSVKTDATGNWQVTLNGQSLPCAVEVSAGTINGAANTNTYHSVAIDAARVNVTPLTDLLVANMLGNASPAVWFQGLNASTGTLSALTQSRADTALANLNAALPTLPLYGAGNNPLTSVFSPTAGNTHDDMLSALQTAMANAGVTYTSLLGSAANTPILPPTALASALSTAYHNTNSGSTVVYFPVDAAVTALESSAVTITSTGTYLGNAISVRQTSTPLGSSFSFEGKTSAASSFTGAMTYLGSTTQLPSSVSYYSVAPYKRLGEVSYGSYVVYANQIPLPSTATIGSSGNFTTGTEYTSSTRSALVDTFVQTWALRAGATANTANLCLTTVTRLASSSAAATTSTTCIGIDTNGNILQLQSVGPVNGTVLTLTSTSIATPPPAVLATVPSQSESNVAVATPIKVTFNKPVDPSTVTSSTFQVFAGSTPIAGTISVASTTATFTPAAPLAPNTQYTVYVRGTIQDLSGTALGNNYVWTFQTRSAPTVTATSPTPYSYLSALSNTVTATFSSAMDATTLNANTFTLSGPSGPISGTVNYSGVTATFTPAAALTINTVYRAQITSDVKDVSGIPVVSRAWTFQTFAPGTSATPQPFTPIPSGLWQPALGTTPSSGNYVYLQSDAGDYIGQGQTYTYTPFNAQIGLNSLTNGVSISVNGNQYWTGYFVGPSTMNQLQVGYYSGLMRWGFHNPVLGGLTWLGVGRGCNTSLGWLAVDNVTYTNGTVSAIDLRFEQQCEGGSTALHGAIHVGP